MIMTEKHFIKVHFRIVAHLTSSPSRLALAVAPLSKKPVVAIKQGTLCVENSRFARLGKLGPMCRILWRKDLGRLASSLPKSLQLWNFRQQCSRAEPILHQSDKASLKGHLC